MTTDHVALAVMHGTTPEQEAGTESKTAVSKNSKRHFEMPETREERIEKAVALVTKLVKGKSVGKGFKVGDCVSKELTKTKAWLYFSLVDAKGNEPEAYSLTSDDAGMDGMERVLLETEADDEVAKIRPDIVLCFRAEYWEGNKAKEKKVNVAKSADDAKSVENADAKKADKKKATVKAAF